MQNRLFFIRWKRIQSQSIMSIKESETDEIGRTRSQREFITSPPAERESEKENQIQIQIEEQVQILSGP